MIEKVKAYEETPSGYKHPENLLQDKINELVDAVNELQKDREEIKEWIGIVSDLRSRVPVVESRVSILEEHAHPTAKTPADPYEELIRTRKALDFAVDALKDNLSQANFTQMLDASRFHCIRTKCELALEQITALEQKDK